MDNETKQLKETEKQLKASKKAIADTKFSKDTLLNKNQVTQIANIFNNVLNHAHDETKQDNQVIIKMMDAYKDAEQFYKQMALKDNYNQEQCELMAQKYCDILDKQQKFVENQLKLSAQERTKKVGLVAIPAILLGAGILVQGLTKFKK